MAEIYRADTTPVGCWRYRDAIHQDLVGAKASLEEFQNEYGAEQTQLRKQVLRSDSRLQGASRGLEASTASGKQRAILRSSGIVTGVHRPNESSTARASRT